MKRFIIIIAVAASLGACAGSRTARKEAPSKGGIPTVLQPNGGKTEARGAGFGAAGTFVR